jgi:hypothetical protein
LVSELAQVALMATLTANPVMKARLARGVSPRGASLRRTPPEPHSVLHRTKAPPPDSLRFAAARERVPPAGPSDSAARERQERRSALYLRLRELSPALFAGLPAPMMCGIRAEIIRRLELDDDRDLAALRSILRQAVARPGYQKALAAEGAMRLDLDDEPVEQVSGEHRARAQGAVDKLKGKVQTKGDGVR